MDFDELAYEQGWNDQTLIIIFRTFISNAGLQDALDQFAQEWADEENEDE
jgi:hypothetical protein